MKVANNITELIGDTPLSGLISLFPEMRQMFM